jgi:energy-coupling factor transporter ATP-binding protein EcfA2
MMTRKPLEQIIECVPAFKKGKDVGYLQDTIHLEESIEPENRVETVRLYYFAKTLKNAFEEILLTFAAREGKGFWLTAEYGVGKSHFLATLACLLSENSEKVWEAVHDPDIRNHQFKFQKRKLFPIVAGLRGKTAINHERPITLLDQIEKEIDKTISQLGLQEKINITPIAETLKLFDGFNATMQGTIQSYIQQKSGVKASELRKNQPERFADLIRSFFKEQSIPFQPAVSIIERLQSLYKQIVDSNTGFNGLLFIIDEYESWLTQRDIKTPEGIFDSNVLQALTEILPKQYGFEIFTVVASQTDMPAQLHGRFKNLPLLAGSGAERDYHVICAHRVRRYKQGTEAEAKLYYHNLYDEFSSYKADTEETFLETFPFHPLSYETVRRFTSSVQDMPAVRLGLNIFYDVMKSPKALQMDKPITIDKVHNYSINFQNALASHRFSDSQTRFLEAKGQLPRIVEDDDDRAVAEAILTILYLQYAISGEQTITMSVGELAEATLTATDAAISGEQRMIVLLDEMAGKIPQLEYDARQPSKGARFYPHQPGLTSQQILDQYKAEYAKRPMEITDCWTKLLLAPLTETKGQKALFAGYAMDKPWKDDVVVNQVTYDGEIMVTPYWKADLGQPLQDAYNHFRLVYLLNPSTQAASQIQDPRIIVIETAPLSDTLKDHCCTYLAAQEMIKEYDPKKQKGPEAAAHRSYAETEYDDAMATIIRYLIEPFQKGKCLTRDDLGIDVIAALGKTTPDQRHQALLRPTIENAYNQYGKLFEVHKIDKPIVPADAKNLFVGLIQGDATKAVRSTLEQKAVGLKLAAADDPRRLNPQHSDLFRMIDDRLAKAPALLLWPLIKEFSGCPYGIPPYLLTAMLLIYVRHRGVPSPVEIELKPDHKLTDQSGKHLTKNLITRTNVVELAWQSNMENHFNTMATVSGPSWNSIQPFAKSIWADAKPATHPQEIDDQISGFLAHLKGLSPLMKLAKDNMQTMANGLGDGISVEDNQSLARVIDLYAAEELEDFEIRRKAIAADLPGFKTVIDRVGALRQLSEKSTQVLQMFNELKQCDTGGNEELSAQKSLLLARYKLSSMIGSPSLVASLLNETDMFFQKLQNAQEVHAKRMLDILKKIKETLGQAAELLKGLALLNQLATLGPTQGHDLADTLEQLTNQVDKELTGGSKLHRGLSYKPPEEEAKEIQKRIRQTFENRSSILRSQLEKVIQGKKQDQVKTLIDLIQISKSQEFAASLTPAIIETIRKILEEAHTQVERTRALQAIADKFPTVGEEDIDQFLTELRQLLQKEFKEKAKQGKKILLSLK